MPSLIALEDISHVFGLWTHDHVPKLAKKCQSLATLLKFLVCKE